MAKITDIKEQVKDKNRVSVYLDGAYKFSLNINQLMELKLKVGSELDERHVDELIEKSNYGKTYDSVLRKLMRRQHSELEIINWLKTKKVEEETITAVVAQLKARKYLNDSNFAQAWANEKRNFKLKSDREIIYELKQKGIASETIQVALQNLELDEESALKNLIEKKSGQGSYKDKLKLTQFLARKGFSYNQIKKLL